ncbi:MAG: flagellar motor protein MotB [Sphingomonas sp.]
MASQAPNNRPIVVRRVKKVTGGHHGGAWKVAYADFVTAMMAFFMLLWLISSPDKSRLKGLAEYFSVSQPVGDSQSTGGSAGTAGFTQKMAATTQNAQGVPAMQAQTAGVARGATASIPDASLKVMAQELRITLDTPQDEGQGHAAKVETDPEQQSLRITLMDTAKLTMFKPGTAILNDFARQRLQTVAQRLAKSSARLSIEGHTDAVGGDSEANWRLSGERALAARAVLIANGITPDRVAGVVAKAGSQPLYPDQPERPENRRITIVVEGQAGALPTDASFRF